MFLISHENKEEEVVEEEEEEEDGCAVWAVGRVASFSFRPECFLSDSVLNFRFTTTLFA